MSIDNFGMYGGRTLYGFSVQASCRRSASSESPFTRKLLPNTLAAQNDVGVTERASCGGNEDVHVVRQDGRCFSEVTFRDVHFSSFPTTTTV